MADIETGNKRLQRREVVRALLENRKDLLVVAGLGAPAWDVTEAGDHPLNFPLWGGMGGAVMIGIGLALAVGLTRVMSGVLFGVSPLDPITCGLVSVLLLVVTVTASYLPARRAARVDPMTALRAE